ncbi:hypothetical protein LshimejAT787_1900430 [Lyophyllum shimeji]|uniref:Tyr recombinase domain-containing protein n=1 Tax=Lyophyllum shimeji TaxID=47721 RepID=A0A9P3UUP6_LYOSH|nr:hypothetical protein LshimejAT787_1900430 [Lyophyllum shimeji]
MHHFPLKPTPDTLSFFVVYMCHHINPRSVANYLSGICNQLEPYFPDVRAVRKSPLVSKTLAGCQRLRGVPTVRKQPLSRNDLGRVVAHYAGSSRHDDRLFVSLLLTGFYALMRLGELTWPDNAALQDDKKTTKVRSVVVSPTQYEFTLPCSKTDRLFEGNRIIVRAIDHPSNPYPHFMSYLTSRNARFPLARELWLTSRGRVPTRTFFIRRLRKFFDPSIAGQSMRAGGATFLAESGTPLHLIQASGRWASETFHIYIRYSRYLNAEIHTRAGDRLTELPITRKRIPRQETSPRDLVAPTILFLAIRGLLAFFESHPPSTCVFSRYLNAEIHTRAGDRLTELPITRSGSPILRVPTHHAALIIGMSEMDRWDGLLRKNRCDDGGFFQGAVLVDYVEVL